MRATVVLIGLAIGTYLLKAAVPVIVGGRPLSTPFTRLTVLLPTALLAALVVTTAFTDGDRFVLDARTVGLGAASVALALRAPFIIVVLVAAVATAAARL